MKKKFKNLKRFKEVLDQIELIRSSYYIKGDDDFYYLDEKKLDKNKEYSELSKELQAFYDKGYYNFLVW